MDKHIYVHIPFCTGKCFYCNFVSLPYHAQTAEAYFDALLREIASLDAGARVSTVYLGGGTPGCVPPAFIGRVLDALASRFLLTHDAEITLETNPDSVDAAKARACAGMGINRVSMGLQTHSDALLSLLGRRHTRDGFLRAYDTISACVRNISVDVIYALPTQTLEDWQATLSFVCALEPQHISAYALEYHAGTPLGGMLETGEISPVSETADRNMYALCVQYLAARGYARYEISNFAQEGRHSRHNLAYWTGEDYLGLGAGAHSYAGGCRFSHTDDIAAYIKDPCRKLDAHKITGNERIEEYVLLRTRLHAGIDCEHFYRCFGQSFDSLFGDRAQRLVSLGLAYYDAKRFALTGRGFDLHSAVAAELTMNL